MSDFSSLVAIGGDPVLSRTSACGGIVLWLELLRRSGAFRNLAVRVAGAQGWSDGQMMLTVLLRNVIGHERVSDVDALEADRSLCRLVRDYEPELLGMPPAALAARFRGGRGRTFPSANAVHDWLRRFHDAAASVTRVKGVAVVPEPAAGLQLVEEVNRRLAQGLIRRLGLDQLTLDLDATVLASGKREAQPTCRGATGEVPNERGYPPLSVFCPELGMVLASEFRDGNVPASVRNLEMLHRTLSGLPPEVRRVWLRSDGAACQNRLLRFCNVPASRPAALRRFGVVGFVVGAPQAEGLRMAIREAPASWWAPVRASEPELECADLDYVSPWGARQSRGELLRYVGTRRALPGELGVGPDETAAASGRPAYRHHAYLTNLPYPGRCGEGAGLAMTASEVVRFAHERCGHGEEVHAALKQDLAGGMLPSGKFGANAAWWQLAVLSANVNALLRHGAFGRDWLWTRMKQVRRSWVHLVAKVVRHARGRRLVFQTAHAQRVRQALDRMAVFLAYDTS